MTNPQEKMKEALEITLSTENERALATIIFDERPDLSHVLASAFDIQFTETDSEKICYTGNKENEGKIKDAFAMLVGAMAAGTYISKSVVKKIARDVNPLKDALSGKFASAANQNNAEGFTPRTEGQALQSKLIDENDITFSIGPAGTGKTHVAMAKAVQAFKGGKIKKIIVARPAVSEDEDIGAVPGTKEDKMDDFMRPLYDELEKTYGIGKHKTMLANKSLEIVLLGKMRGRTFENAFIIVDEAQNCKFRQLKTALTRLGPGSKMVITGDPEQSDLKEGMSGLQEMADKLQGVEGIAIQYYEAADVVRHPTVQRIIERLGTKTGENKPKIAPPPATH